MTTERIKVDFLGDVVSGMKVQLAAWGHNIPSGADPQMVVTLFAIQLQGYAQVQLDDDAMDAILKSHVIDPALLRADSFLAFYSARKVALLTLVERAMGKASAEANVIVADDEEGDDDEGEAA